MKSTQLNFTPALPCVECQELTTQGLISPVSLLAWHLLPRCDKHLGEPEPSESRMPVSGSVLGYRISEQLAVIRHLQHTRRRVARAYMQVRRYHTHTRAERALRRQLRRLCQAWAMEVQR
jgi:hypothetical protein